MVASLHSAHHPLPSSPALDLLDAVSDRAYAVLGSCGGRLARAVAIARSGAVTHLSSGLVEVRSQAHTDLTYTVNGSCSCPDASRAPQGHCKHLLASWIVRRVHSLETH